MTIPMLIQGLKKGLNVGADFSTVIGSAGILSVPGNLLATSFTLEDLRKHNFPSKDAVWMIFLASRLIGS